MNNNIKKFIAYIVLIGCLSGCSVLNSQDKPAEETRSETEAATKELVALEDAENAEDTEDTNDINGLETNLEGFTLLEMKNYIDTHLTSAQAGEMDAMVAQYDQTLRDYYRGLFEKFVTPPYFQAINDSKDEQYVLHVDKIENLTIREEVLEAIDMGYCFSMQEGAYYLVIDYKDISSNYGAYLSETYKAYYKLKMDEQLKPIRVEEYLNLSSEELYQRAVLLESILEESPNFVFRDDIKKLMAYYVDGLLSIDIFSGTIDYETGQVSQSTIEIYKKILDKEKSVMIPAIEEMMAFLDTKDFILKFDDQTGNQEVLVLRHKYITEMPNMIDVTYSIE